MRNLLISVPFVIAIIGITVFAILCLLYLIYYMKDKRRDEERMQSVISMYDDTTMRRDDYDSAAYDKETKRIIAEMRKKEGQITIDDVMPSQPKEEEITGNYKHE